MSKLNKENFKQMISVIAVALVILSVSIDYLLTQPITAQNQLENLTGNQTGNQTGGLNLVPPRVIEEETQAEIFGGQQ
jgi:hypothetical protein